MKHRYDTVKHFFADIFTNDQIEGSFRYEPPVEDTQSASEKANGIAEKYADMELVPTTPRADRDIKREIRAVMPELIADMPRVRHIPE
jgi:hypothetical protein